MKKTIPIRLFPLLAVAICFPCAPALAAPGDLDTTFGTGGKVTTSFSTSVDRVNSVVLQSDGKIVAAGYLNNHGGFALARYTTNGALDTAFDTDGKVTTTIGSDKNAAYGAAVQSDGKIVAAGYSWDGTGSSRTFAVVRYNTEGSLDTSFDTDGKVTTAIGSGDSYGECVAVQSDGKIVVAGFSSNGTNNDFAVVRYNTNGSLDTSFGSGGIVTTSLGSGDDAAKSVAVQSDGKIVVAGDSNTGTYSDFAVVRYNADGSLDTTFDGDGKVTTAIGSADDYGLGVAIQGDGRILMVGYSDNGTNDDIAVVRYHSNGTLDATFNATGKVTTAIGSGADRGYAVTPQSDGKILVAGYSFVTNNDFALVRYNSNGSLDTSFGGTGMVTTAISSGADTGRAMALQNDGKIVVAGDAGTSSDFALARYYGVIDPEIAVEQPAGTNLTDASGQTNFGRVQVGGTPVVKTFTIRNPSTATLTILDVTKDGTNADNFTVGALGATTLVAGASTTFTVTFAPTATGSRSAAIHIASNDADENTFDIYLSGTGIVPPTIATYQVLPCGTVSSAYNVPLDASGTSPFTWAVTAGSPPSGLSLSTSGILSGTPSAAGVAGFTVQVTDNDGLSTTRACTLKVMATSEPGALDVSFGAGGKVITPVGSGDDQGQSVAIQSNGKIVVAGSYRNSDGNDDFSVVRYNSNGALDSTFGSGGIATRLLSSNDDRCNGVVLQSGGGIVAAGYGTWTGPTGFTAVRFDTNGSIDLSFRSGGRQQTTQIGTGACGYGAAVQSDDKIVVAGSANNGSNNDFAIVRYNSNGSLDTSFDTDGSLTTPIGSGEDVAYGVAIQSDGKIVVAGCSNNGSNNDFAVVRYHSNGSLDTSFGSGGKVTTAIGSGHEVAFGLAIQSDGKIVVVGYADTGSTWDFAVARYNSNGTLDTSFGSGGKVTTAVGDSTDIARSVVVTPTGKILVAGKTFNGLTNHDTALVFYNPNGSLVTSFGNNGIVTTHVGTKSDECMSMALQNDGKIVVAGNTSNGSNDDFMVARYVGITEPEIVVEQPEGTNLIDGTGSVDWGYCEINAVTGGRMFTVRNTGNADLTGLAVTIDGVNAGDFSLPYLGATSLAPGATTTFLISFGPSVSGYRSATIHVASNDADENPFDIAVSGTGLSHLEVWRMLNFGSHLNSGNGADLTDYDHDGFANLLEYAFGGNPKVADGAAMRPTSGLSGGKLGISFKCDATLTDITYTVQASSTMASGSWTDIARSVGGATVVPIGSLSQVTDSGAGLRTATVTAAPGVFPTGRGFLRIRISE